MNTNGQGLGTRGGAFFISSGAEAEADGSLTRGPGTTSNCPMARNTKGRGHQDADGPPD
jgi:hypothetical protein